MKKIYYVLLVALLVGFCFVSQITQVLAEETKVLKFAHIYEPGHLFADAAEYFVSQFEEKTDGRYQIDLFPAGQMGNIFANQEDLQLNIIDITFTAQDATAKIYPPMGMMTAPYIFRDMEHFLQYLDSDLHKEFVKEYEKIAGVHVIGSTTGLMRHVTANKPIRKPSDMKGLKIRVPMAPCFVAMPNAVGASPTPIDFGEVYMALKQKIINAQENPIITIYSMKFYEVQKYINLTGHMIVPFYIAVSSNLWDSLPAEDQEILLNCGKETSLQIIEKDAEITEEILNKLKEEGNIIIEDVDCQAFAEACIPFNTNFSESAWNEDQYRRLQAIGQ